MKLNESKCDKQQERLPNTWLMNHDVKREWTRPRTEKTQQGKKSQRNKKRKDKKEVWIERTGKSWSRIYEQKARSRRLEVIGLHYVYSSVKIYTDYKKRKYRTLRIWSHSYNNAILGIFNRTLRPWSQNHGNNKITNTINIKHQYPRWAIFEK